MGLGGSCPSTQWDLVVGDSTNDWSAWARILGFMEETGLAANVTITGNEDTKMPDGTPVQALPNWVVCLPVGSSRTGEAEYRRHAERVSDELRREPGTVAGLRSGESKELPSGSFYPNSRLTPRNFTDGLSHTLLAAEVKMWTSYYSAGNATSTMPTTTDAICSLGTTPKMGPNVTDNKAHTSGETARRLAAVKRPFSRHERGLPAPGQKPVQRRRTRRRDGESAAGGGRPRRWPRSCRAQDKVET